MNFYTLEYDCNTPTTQQINAPTNTDYKVGMKVRRNGEVQSINPSALTVMAQDGTVLSVDSEKTNGYVTITRASGDNASFKQYDVKIDTTDYVDISAENSNTGRSTQCQILSADLEPYYDRTLFGVNVKLEYKPNVDADFEDVDYAAMTSTTPIRIFTSASDTYAKYQWFGDCVFTDEWGAANKRFIEYDDTGHPVRYLDSIPLQDTTKFILAITGRNNKNMFPKFQFNESSTNPLVIRLTLITGDIPFSADFKLNINEFKSQKGDINLVGRASTVNFAGTDGQGNPFSYDVIVK
jgi:hypothetical protein